MDRKILRVWLQLENGQLQTVSRQVITTARALGDGYVTQGVAVTGELRDPAVLKHCGLEEVILAEGEPGFVPEAQAELLCSLEKAEILLFPATPEGRTLSAMVGARLHTGVTADCSALSFQEDGALLQTRPAFSGGRLASIVTETRPQIASLRFGMEVPEPEKETRVIRRRLEPSDRVTWTDRAQTGPETVDLALAVGGGLGEKQDVQRFQALADRLSCPLYCSRALVDRGWMPRSRQIGLSGGSIRAELLVTFGVSGSVQFQAGLGHIGTLIAVDRNGKSPLMALADLPLKGDLYELLGELEKQLGIDKQAPR